MTTDDNEAPHQDCKVPHTKFNPAMTDYLCPKCGATNDSGAFYIQEPAPNTHHECGALHKDDMVGCDECGWGATGNRFANLILKKKGMVPCTHCKGTGLVAGAKT